VRSTEKLDASDCVLSLFGKLWRSRGASAWFHSVGKLWRRRGALAWFHGIWTWQCKSSWKLNDFFTKLNPAENFRGIGMCLWCCWKDLDGQDLMEFIW